MADHQPNEFEDITFAGFIKALGPNRKATLTADGEPLVSELTLISGQQPKKCKHDDIQEAPAYRTGSITYSVEGPKTLFLAISVDARYFSRDYMVALTREIKADFCHERRLVVAILDNHNAARAFAPTIENVWFKRYWRGDYFFDKDFGAEELNFSTAPGRSRDEMKISLAAINRNNQKATARVIPKE